MTKTEFFCIFEPFVYATTSEQNRPDKNTYNAYYEFLKGYDLELLARALKEVAKTHQFNYLPKIAQICACIEGGVETKISLAIKTLKQAMMDFSSWRSVSFADPLIAKALLIALGQNAWVEYGRLTGRALENFHAFEFKKAYLAAMQSDISAPTFFGGQEYHQSRGGGDVGLVGYIARDEQGQELDRVRLEYFRQNQEPKLIAHYQQILGKKELAPPAPLKALANAKRISNAN